MAAPIVLNLLRYKSPVIKDSRSPVRVNRERGSLLLLSPKLYSECAGQQVYQEIRTACAFITKGSASFVGGKSMSDYYYK